MPPYPYLVHDNPPLPSNSPLPLFKESNLFQSTGQKGKGLFSGFPGPDTTVFTQTSSPFAFPTMADFAHQKSANFDIEEGYCFDKRGNIIYIPKRRQNPEAIKRAIAPLNITSETTLPPPYNQLSVFQFLNAWAHGMLEQVAPSYFVIVEGSSTSYNTIISMDRTIHSFLIEAIKTVQTAIEDCWKISGQKAQKYYTIDELKRLHSLANPNPQPQVHLILQGFKARTLKAFAHLKKQVLLHTAGVELNSPALSSTTQGSANANWDAWANRQFKTYYKSSNRGSLSTIEWDDALQYAKNNIVGPENMQYFPFSAPSAVQKLSEAESRMTSILGFQARPLEEQPALGLDPESKIPTQESLAESHTSLDTIIPKHELVEPYKTPASLLHSNYPRV